MIDKILSYHEGRVKVIEEFLYRKKLSKAKRAVWKASLKYHQAEIERINLELSRCEDMSGEPDI